MKNSGISHIMFFLPKFNLIPFEEVKNWAEKYYQRLSHTNAQRKKSIRTHKDFKEKIGRPTIDATSQFISPDFKSRSGLTHDAIIGKLKDKMLDNTTSRKYQEKIERAYETIGGVPARRIKDKLDMGSNEYAQKMTFGAWRFIGPLSDESPDICRDIRASNSPDLSASRPKASLALMAGGGSDPTVARRGAFGGHRGQTGSNKGAVILAGEWLSGDPATVQHLRDKDRIIAGSPVLISESKRAGQLRKQLKNQLLRSGKNISEGHYAPQIIKEENETVNQLVQGFSKDEIEPFSSGGGSHRDPVGSHIDFVLIPETVTPADARQVKDIEYKIRSFFLGEKMAQILRSKCIETNYYAPINPDDYIGNWKKPAYFDMYLDIQVTGK